MPDSNHHKPAVHEQQRTCWVQPRIDGHNKYTKMNLSCGLFCLSASLDASFIYECS